MAGDWGLIEVGGLDPAEKDLELLSHEDDDKYAESSRASNTALSTISGFFFTGNDIDCIILSYSVSLSLISSLCEEFGEFLRAKSGDSSTEASMNAVKTVS